MRARAPIIASAYTYLYPEWLRVQRQFIRSPQISAVVQGGLVPNPQRDRIPWRHRPRRMVLVKTGADPIAQRAGWADLPPRMRAVVEDAAAEATKARTGDVTDLVLAAMEANHVSYHNRTDILFGLMTEVDRYVRDARSTALVTALLHLPVDIHGRGWDHLAPHATRARFHPPFDAANLETVYAETQFLLNTTPNFASGVHERVAYGFDARCCVVSDANAYMQQTLTTLPTFFPIDPASPNLAHHLQTILDDPTDYTDQTQPALDFATRTFDGPSYMQTLLGLAAELQMAERFADYRH